MVDIECLNQISEESRENIKESRAYANYAPQPLQKPKDGEIMVSCEQVYPSIGFESFQGYPNYFDMKWLNNSPRFRSLPINHIVEFLKNVSELEFEGEDVLVKLFILSLP